MGFFDRQDPCTFVRERLELFLDGELTGSDRLFFQTHLKECDDCAGYWADDEEIATALLVALGRRPTVPAEHVFAAPGPRTAPARSAFERSRDTDRRPPPARRPGRALAAAGLAAGLLLAVGALGYVLGEASRPVEEPAEAARALPVAASPGLWRSRDLAWRGSDEASWEPLETGRAPLPGSELTARGGRAGVLGFEGCSLVLDEGSLARFEGPEGAAGAAPIELELAHGRLDVDVEDREIVLRCGDASLSGVGVSFVARAGHQDESVCVLRGEILLRTSRETLTLGSGQSATIGRDGTVALVPAAAPEDGAELARRLEGLRVEVESLRRRNEVLLARIDDLEDRAAPAVEVVAFDEILGSYLDIVERTESLRLDPPSPLARETAGRLRESGEDVVVRLVSALGGEAIPLRRRALVGLLAEVDLPESRRALEQACFDAEPAVREAALFCLSRRPDPDLGRHFVAVLRVEKEFSIRARAALHAARRGEAEGRDGLLALHHETTSPYWRTRLVGYLGVLEGGGPEIDRFLRGLLLDPESGVGETAAAIRGLERRGDMDALPALRELVARPGLTPELRRLATDAVMRLQERY